MKFDFSRWGNSLYQCSNMQYLANLDLKEISSGVFQITCFSNYLNFYIKNFSEIKEGAGKLLVGFGGALSSRDSSTVGPFFSFGNIASELNVPLISFSDSSLYLDNNIKLAWYSGNVFFQKQQSLIAQVIELICLRYGLEPILCGGSGGGFASLAISTLLEHKHQCFVWNPQTSIQKYYNRFVNEYIQICYPNFQSKNRSTQFGQIGKYGIIHDVTTVALNKNVTLFYIQNMSDEFHVTHHCLPFIEKHKFQKSYNDDIYFKYFSSSNKLILGCNWGVGHLPPSSKQIVLVLKELIKDQNLEDVSNSFFEILKK